MSKRTQLEKLMILRSMTEEWMHTGYTRQCYKLTEEEINEYESSQRYYEEEIERILRA